MTSIEVAGTSGAQLGAANTFTIGPQTIQAGASGNKGLIVKMAAGPTVSPIEVETSIGTITAKINPDSPALVAAGSFGDITEAGPYLQATSSMLNFLPRNATQVPLTITAFTAQTANLLEAKDAATAVHFALTAGGLPRWVAAGDQQTTVGAAGAASTLPSAPTKYLKVVDSSGTTLVIPAYLAA